ncbi:gamma-glutamyltranspeptidase [Bradyrhizobium sp. LM6.11]
MMSSFSTRRAFFAFVATLAFSLPTATAQDARRAYVPPALDTVHAVPAEHGMVVAQEKISAQVGADILRRGGNAVDAAVATGFAMAVTYPRAGNIGGGGFMVIHSAERNEDITIDYRETAPAATTPQIFLGADGKPDAAKSRDSALGVGVPGTVAGLALALEKYGSGQFTLAQLLEPAIAIARDGFVVSDDIADTLPGWHRRLARAGPRQPKSSRDLMARHSAKATGWCRAISPKPCRPSPHRVRAVSMRVRSRKSSPRP